MQRRSLALIAGFLSILPIVLAGRFPGLVFMAFFVPLPLFAAGLGLGTGPYLIAGATAVLLWGVMSGLDVAFSIFMTLVAPIGLLVHQALKHREDEKGNREWYPPGRLLIWLTLCGVLWLIAALIVFSQGEAVTIQVAVEEEIRLVLKALDSQIPSDQREAVVQVMAPVALGVSAAVWLAMLSFNAALAQSLLTKSGKALRPSPRLAEIEISPWMAIAFGLAVAGALVTSGEINYAAKNLALVLSVPFFFGGLAVVHLFFAALPGQRFLLILFYVLLPLVPWIAGSVVVLGVIDQWVGLRRFIKRSRQNREEE